MGKTLTVRIPDELHEELLKASKKEAKAVSDLVRESIQRYLAISAFRNLRTAILPFAEAQGILTDEDVFKAFS